MQTPIRLTLLLLLAATGLTAQKGKHIRSSGTTVKPTTERLQLRPETQLSVPTPENPFGLPEMSYRPLKSTPRTTTASAIEVLRDANGAPIFYTGNTEASPITGDASTVGATALAYLQSIAPEGIIDPAAEFAVSIIQTDEQDNYHVRIAQNWKGIPVYGCELIAHSQNRAFVSLNGRFIPSPKLESVTPAFSAAAAVELLKNDIGAAQVKTSWSETDLKFIGGVDPYQSALVVYRTEAGPRLAWHITAHPNLLKRYIYFVDAQTGAILNKYDHTCNVFGPAGHVHSAEEEVVDGPVTANGTDLLGVSRSFGAWQVGGTFYMEDTSQPMFSSSSQMPDEPVGAIVTLDAKNTSPAVQNSFDFDFVKSSSLAFNNTNAVSTHWNSIKSYLYYKNKFNRNSIDGSGGNILAFFNVAEDDGSSMENAFWNGAAMWYGNGGSTFKKLARGLDVGGHEMTHGVVEKTANLEYQGESGALNESFADIFGAMIDLGDWQIGEDVMQSGTHTCLRDLSNPNNGVSSNSPFWQPAHKNQQYNGSADNGGVHINSGIVNKAYFLFATASGVGTDKAEQVYYKALRDYLVKSSQFVDCRAAIIQAANDLYGSPVANAAASAFDQVGIVGSGGSGGSTGGSNYLGQLAVNPGTPFLLCVADDLGSFDIADANGNVLGALYNDDNIKSRPSITDDGSTVVFVNETGHIILMDISYANGQILTSEPFQISDFPEWRNVAISKNGRFLAAITDFQDNNVYVYDRENGYLSETFSLYNPTYTQGQSTGNVQYADVLEFDYSGSYIMYDAYNKIVSPTTGQSIDYWDIGFVQFWDNGTYANGASPYIEKLFSGLPENTNVGDPSFAKNSPYIIAFDYYEGDDDLNYILGANIETGDNDLIASNIGDYGWPNYNKNDNSLVFHKPSTFGYDIYKIGLNSTKIQPQGTATKLVNNHVYGVWYANGNRSLMVEAPELASASLMGLQVSPNPTGSTVQLRFELASAGALSVSVTDLLGVRLMEKNMEAPKGSNTLDLDLNTLPAGTYLVNMRTAAGQGTLKVVKI